MDKEIEKRFEAIEARIKVLEDGTYEIANALIKTGNIKEETEYQMQIKDFARELPKFKDGRINYKDQPRRMAIHVHVYYNGKLLLLKRSDKVGVYKGYWNIIGGYLDNPDQKLEDKAREELREEIGYEGRLLIHTMEPYEFEDKDIEVTWIVYPVMALLSERPKIKLDWEHTEYKWIVEKALKASNVIPALRRMGR